VRRVRGEDGLEGRGSIRCWKGLVLGGRRRESGCWVGRDGGVRGAGLGRGKGGRCSRSCFVWFFSSFFCLSLVLCSSLGFWFSLSLSLSSLRGMNHRKVVFSAVSFYSAFDPSYSASMASDSLERPREVLLWGLRWRRGKRTPEGGGVPWRTRREHFPLSELCFRSSTRPNLTARVGKEC